MQIGIFSTDTMTDASRIPTVTAGGRFSPSTTATTCFNYKQSNT